MASYNKVILMGNLTRDPEVRYTPKGTAVCDLGLAINRTYTNDAGEQQKEVTFLEVTFWGRKAEVAQQYLTKGRPIFIEGRLQLDTSEDPKTGKPRNRVRIVAESFEFLGSRGDREEGGGGGGPHPNAHPSGRATVVVAAAVVVAAVVVAAATAVVAAVAHHAPHSVHRKHRKTILAMARSRMAWKVMTSRFDLNSGASALHRALRTAFAIQARRSRD